MNRREKLFNAVVCRKKRYLLTSGSFLNEILPKMLVLMFFNKILTFPFPNTDNSKIFPKKINQN